MDVLLERTERAIVIWIEEQVQRRIPVSGYLIKKKLFSFYKSMKQSEPSTSTSQAGKEFSASKGWLTRFLKRNALHNFKIIGKSATADEGAAKIFPEELAKIIEDGDYSADQVFNADETGLYWKKMPNRTYIAKEEKTASGHKASKDRVTLLLCSNASGDRMLKPLLINKSLRPRALKGKDLKQLPLHWMANPKSWMTTAIFTEWFNNCFVPEVEAYMKEKSLDFKVVLIVDNAASHPQLEHPNVQLVFLPPNTTSLIQPLDQGIIATFKKYYIKTTDNDIIDLTLDLTVDGVVGLEGDNDEEEKSTPLTGKLIQEGVQLAVN
ncbi:tigger transposable element-derived protein 1 [Trichonephila clavipes]|nr:tigger transposable element-derived protein 1 [Trichonephila clavipes]